MKVNMLLFSIFAHDKLQPTHDMGPSYTQKYNPTSITDKKYVWSTTNRKSITRGGNQGWASHALYIQLHFFNRNKK